jgi:SAM-dependent methyltransferase
MGAVRRLIDRALEIPIVYQGWQAFHDREKLEYVASRIMPRPGLKVLELGCGPGTNAHLFTGCQYLGIDINPEYVKKAQRLFPEHTFVTADVLRYDFTAGAYDWVLVNSFLHHIDDQQVRAIFAAVARIRAARVLILDLVLPAEPSVARLLARLDRGEYARPIEAWRALLPSSFAVHEETPVRIRRGGVRLYELIGYVLEPPRA